MGLYSDFLEALKASRFDGDLSEERSDRQILATDNSIYQVLPDAVVFPRSVHDLQRIGRLLCEPRFEEIVVRPRGGGTGTNGQSLGQGLVIEFSRSDAGPGDQRGGALGAGAAWRDQRQPQRNALAARTFFLLPSSRPRTAPRSAG